MENLKKFLTPLLEILPFGIDKYISGLIDFLVQAAELVKQFISQAGAMKPISSVLQQFMTETPNKGCPSG